MGTDRPRLGKWLGKSGAPSDSRLSRQNAPLKLKGHGVTLDVVGARVRLVATMPPRPTDSLGTGLRQHRISTGLAYPDQASEALRGERGTGFGSSFSCPPHREIAVRAGVLVGEQGVSSGSSPTEGGGRAVIGQRPGSLLSSAGALVGQRARGKSRACRPSPGSAGRRLPASADRCGRSGC